MPRDELARDLVCETLDARSLELNDARAEAFLILGVTNP
jgi:hypothetical protein